MVKQPMIQMLVNVLFIFIIVLVCIVALVYFATKMPGESFADSLPPVSSEVSSLSERLKDHVVMLAGEIGERNNSSLSKLNEAADYIEKQFELIGYVPSSQIYSEEQFRNISVDIYGKERRDEIIVVGAHYDTTWLTPGADDNASGVAGLLELARLLRDKELNKTLRLIAFTNEEMPFFGRDEMGSRVAAKRSYDRQENIIGMFSLEMIGYYKDEPGTQFYPPVIRQFYPDTGNFIAFVGNLSSRAFLHEAIQAFRDKAQFPSEGLAAPQWLVPDIRRSDNSAYWYYGFPALMVTDTANFRNRNYHKSSDTYETLNYEYMARAVDGLALMLEEMAK